MVLALQAIRSYYASAWNSQTPPTGDLWSYYDKSLVDRTMSTMLQAPRSIMVEPIKGCGRDMKGLMMYYVEENEGQLPREQLGSWQVGTVGLFRCGQADLYKNKDGTRGVVTRLCHRCMKKKGFIW